ncbi:MAG: hypothetical protein FWH19_00990 [Treponema sp.]|nr:hypothetical protein [Treponema sp.]
MRFKFLFIQLTIATAAVLFFTGCGNGSHIRHVEREDLFTLEIGRLEDQIALFDIEGGRGVRTIDIAMRDGLFYIVDGNGAKIQRYNSYGDLLFMIYNEEVNPPPMSLRHLTDESILTRWAVSYPLLEPGEITVDSRKHIYVRERLPSDRHGFDMESRALLDNIVLHFDADGNFIKHLGREGAGGSPFPKIEKIHSSFRDEIAVVCRLPTGWDVYWYDSEGLFLFLIRLRNDALPIPPDRGDVIPSLDTIAVSPDARRLYVKIDYYHYTRDESTNTRTGIEPEGSVLWIMNVEDGHWTRYVDLPFYETFSTDQSGRISHRNLYSLFGVVANGRVFFYVPVEGGYSILVMSTEFGTSGQFRGFIRVENEELHYNVFDLSREGIISGLLADEWQVKLAWWRTDRMLGDTSQW